MDYNAILLRYGELFLKGKNASWFEKKLIENTKKLTGVKEIKRARGRLILNYFPEHQQLKRVFGLVSYSPALRVEKELETIKKAVWEHFKDKKGSFRIETKRSDKTFPLKSLELNALLGRFLEERNKNLSFGFENHQHFLNLELNLDGAYLFTETIDCFGGLPVGTGGRVALLLENGNSQSPQREGYPLTPQGVFKVCDTPHLEILNPTIASNGVSQTNGKSREENQASLLAGLLMMKRGCSVYPIGFKEQDLSVLQKFSPAPLTFKLVQDFKELDPFAKEKSISVLVVGDTFETRKEYKTDLMVMKPLVAYNSGQAGEQLIQFQS